MLRPERGPLAKVTPDYPDVPTTTIVRRPAPRPGDRGASSSPRIAPTHFPLAKRALEAGKHVLVEKPMTLTTADAAELTRVADAGRPRAHGRPPDGIPPGHPAICRLIDSRASSARSGGSSRGGPTTARLRTDENVWWSFAPHDISMAVRLMGEWPTTVHCEGQCIVQTRVADVVGGTLRFPGGRVARIDVSWHDPAKVRELKVYGSKKWVVFDDTLPWDRKVLVHDRGFDVNLAAAPDHRPPCGRAGQALPLDQTEPLVAEARHFVECIRTRARPLSDGRSGTGIVAILEAGQASLEAGREVPVTVPAAGLRIAG